jgi:hypothetical protein
MAGFSYDEWLESFTPTTSMSPEQLAKQRAHGEANEILRHWLAESPFRFGQFGQHRSRKWCVDELAEHFGIALPRGTWQERKLFLADALGPSQAMKDAFYDSWAWSELRFDTLQCYGRRCMCCGATPETGARIVVDHIEPLRYRWSRRLDRENLQVLCDDCNKGKGARDRTDFRPEKQISLRPVRLPGLTYDDEEEVDELTAEYRRIVNDEGPGALGDA